MAYAKVLELKRKKKDVILNNLNGYTKNFRVVVSMDLHNDSMR